MRFLNSDTVPKNVKRGDPLGFFDIHYVVKYRNKRRGDPSGQSRTFKKKSHSAKTKSEWKGGSYIIEVLAFRVCFGRP